MGCHPRRPDLGGEPVEDLGSVTGDDQDEMVGGHLHDVETAKPLDLPGSGHDFALGAGEQLRTLWFPEVQVIDDRRGHRVTLIGAEASGRAQRSVGALARMGRALVPRAEALVARRRNRAPRGRRVRRHVRRDLRVGFASSRNAGELEPHRRGARTQAGPGADDTAVRAAAALAGAGYDVHDDVDRDQFRPGRSGRVPRAPAPTPAAFSPAVAPGHPRDVAAAGDGTGSVDLEPCGTGGEGHVDLAVGQHRGRRC